VPPCSIKAKWNHAVKAIALMRSGLAASASTGVPGPHFMAWATILVEILGGLAVILGAFVTLASLPMAAVLLVAIFTVHLPYGFSSIKLQTVTAAGAQFGPPGYEVDLLYLACLAALVLGGPGPLAIGGLIRKWRKVRSSQHRPRSTTATTRIISPQ